ncbi:uncharacterized protein [Mytilus edulis]|uniref:uncharacterized protein isoform X1 n=1 Tax=Mytilus edulis TaxID=6550 RepID=UPI0039EF8FF9
MSAARYIIVTIVVLCCLSVVLSRPHEKKHKHKHRWQTERSLVVNDDSKKDIVINDEIHHQELILPKQIKQTDSSLNLAFDVLTPTSIKKVKKLVSKKRINNHDVFLNQEAISFDSESQLNEVDSGSKDKLWHNLYEIKEPDNKIISHVTDSKEPVPDVKDNKETVGLLEPHSDQTGNTDNSKDIANVEKKSSDDVFEDTAEVNVDESSEEEDEDGIDDDYDNYQDYNYFDKEADKEEIVENLEKENVPLEGKIKQDEKENDEIITNTELESKKSWEELVMEIYGGVLPYSASIDNIRKQINEKSSDSAHNTGKKNNKEIREKLNENDLVLPGYIEKDTNIEDKNVGKKSSENENYIDLSYKTEKPFNPNVEQEKEQNNGDLQEIKTTSKPQRLQTSKRKLKPDVIPVSKTTLKAQTPSTGKPDKVEPHFNEPEKESDLSETPRLNPAFKTTNVAKTSPNPPTTKAVSVTAAPIKGVKEYIQSKPLQLCMDDGGCSPGRMCHSGVCVCGDATLCQGHHHKVAVCGSDGQLYSSHCELHRQACLKQTHIKVNRDGQCGQNLQEHFKIQPIYEGTQCEYTVFKGQEGILWGDILMPVSVKSLLECSDLCDKKSQNSGCFAFQYSAEKSGLCFLFEKPTDIIRHPNSEMDFYEQRRCQPNPDYECDYEPVNLVAEHIYAMCNVKTSVVNSYEECRDSCQNCTAFTFRKDENICDVHHSKACIDMMNALGIVHYIKRCNEKGDICNVLEVIPGKSPFMCSKATSSVSSLIECHDACVHGRCEAFQYLTKDDQSTACEIFFDKSCIELLNKKKENYYVKRCTNPKDCDYHQIQSARMMPCRVTSSDMNTMEKCRDMCNVDSCFGFRYNYDSLKCDLYSDQSCVLGKNLNYVIKKCHSKQAEANLKMVPQLNELPIPKPVIVNKEQEGKKDKADSNKKVQQKPKITTTPLPSTKAPYNVMPKSLDNFNEDDLVCSQEDYVQFKSDLLRYHCVRFRETHCDENVIPNKGYIASLMFSYYDRDMNGDISNDELWEMQVAENLEHISTICTLLDILKYEVKDSKLDHFNFLNAFTVADAVIEEDLEIIHVTSTAGNGLEIKCGVPMLENSEVVWRRNNIDLNTISIPDMAVFSDGTLYFEDVGLHHTGNYTCYDKVKPGVKEIHVLNVNLRPIVRVSPAMQTLEMNSLDLFIDCHVDGIPQPSITWQINNEKLPYKPKHFITTHNNGTLMIHNSDIVRDTGSYKCKATNIVGNAEAEAKINKPGTPEKKRLEAFYAFHKNGYTAYEPEGCETVRHVKGDFGNLKYIPEELDRAPSMCGIGQDCVWGGAVNVQNKYIYSSQPEHNRVIIIDIANTYNPVQIVKTDKYPVKLYYVADLDEVWILCWNADHNSGSKTIVVIRDASKDVRHHIVHTQPVGYRFDLVEDIFLPPQNDLDHKFKHGYVIHSKQRGLFKLDLDSMRYTKAVDFEKQDCIPKSVAFIPIGGYIVVECHRHVQIIMDYITDSVVYILPVKGTPYVSPDSRNLIFVQMTTGHVTVYSVQENGTIKKRFEVTTGSALSDVTFFPSDIRTGYDMFLAAVGEESIYPVRLDNGQVTKITGKDEARTKRVWPWSRSVRTIVTGDMFSQYVAAPSKSTVLLLNGRDKRIHCSYPGLDSPDQIVYVSTIV